MKPKTEFLEEQARNDLRRADMYVGHNLKMRLSPAWRALPDNARRVLDLLEVQHMRGAMKANGRLYFTYDDFEAAGMRRGSVRLAIEQAKALGFLDVPRRGYSAKGDIHVASLYRLTYAKSHNGKPPATNEWVAIKDDKAACEALRKAKADLEDERADNRLRLTAKKAAAAGDVNKGKSVSPGR